MNIIMLMRKLVKMTKIVHAISTTSSFFFLLSCQSELEWLSGFLCYLRGYFSMVA